MSYSGLLLLPPLFWERGWMIRGSMALPLRTWLRTRRETYPRDPGNVLSTTTFERPRYLLTILWSQRDVVVDKRGPWQRRAATIARGAQVGGRVGGFLGAVDS